MKRQTRIAINSLLTFLLVVLLLIFCSILEIETVFVLFLLAVYTYLKVFYRTTPVKSFKLLYVSLLFVIFFAAANIIIQQAGNKEGFIYFIPISAVVMFTTIIFNDLHLAFVMSVVSSLSAGLLVGNLMAAFIFFITAIVSICLVWGVRQRSAIIKAGFLSGIIQLLCILFLNNFKFNLEQFQSFYYVPVISGFLSGAVVVGTLPIFEYLFNIVTNISLLELADYKHPLLQKMSLEAPGTYHHSLIVSNLGEAAAEAIGANSLLVRVGSYYHDIGKIEKPEYFSENQIPPFSKHDRLAPTISKMLITNHVREGTELAKRYKLNSKIIDFIAEHHGTSLVYFFYVRALEEKEQDEELEEEQFRYPGPKPQSRETAIVLLADSVEAASRTLQDPTPAKMEDLTHKIINNKFIDGQLDECDLTLRDLEVISKVFSRILIGIYHARIKYPEKKPNADLKKSTKDTTSQDRNKRDT